MEKLVNVVGLNLIRSNISFEGFCRLYGYIGNYFKTLKELDTLKHIQFNYS